MNHKKYKFVLFVIIVTNVLIVLNLKSYIYFKIKELLLAFKIFVILQPIKFKSKPFVYPWPTLCGEGIKAGIFYLKTFQSRIPNRILDTKVKYLRVLSDTVKMYDTYKKNGQSNNLKIDISFLLNL